MLSWTACTAIQRLRKEHDPGDQVAVQVPPFRRTEPRTAAVKGCTGYATSNGAGDGIDRQGGDCRQRSLRGCSATHPEAADFGRTLPVHAKRACENRRSAGRWMSPNNLTFPVRRDADPPFPGGFLLMGSGCLGLAKIGTARAGLRAPGEPARLFLSHQPNRP